MLFFYLKKFAVGNFIFGFMPEHSAPEGSIEPGPAGNFCDLG